MRMPPGLSKQAKEYWVEIGELTHGDRICDNPSALSLYCEAYAQWKAALKQCEAGSIVTIAGKPMDNPYLAVADRAEVKLSRLLKTHGGEREITPDSLDSIHLTSKQLAFCESFVVSNDPLKAAISAGYSEKTAQSQGSQLLVHPKIKAYLALYRSEMNQHTVVDLEMIRAGLLKVARESKQDGARVNAWTQLAKLGGFYEIDNSQRGVQPDMAAFDALSMSEQRQYLAALKAKAEEDDEPTKH